MRGTMVAGGGGDYELNAVTAMIQIIQRNLPVNLCFHPLLTPPAPKRLFFLVLVML